MNEKLRKMLEETVWGRIWTRVFWGGAVEEHLNCNCVCLWLALSYVSSLSAALYTKLRGGFADVHSRACINKLYKHSGVAHTERARVNAWASSPEVPVYPQLCRDILRKMDGFCMIRLLQTQALNWFVYQYALPLFIKFSHHDKLRDNEVNQQLSVLKYHFIRKHCSRSTSYYLLALKGFYGKFFSNGIYCHLRGPNPKISYICLPFPVQGEAMVCE